jgi:hypothetical protein
MSTATRTYTQSCALHAADSHDLIRVHGAHENNLKDVRPTWSADNRHYVSFSASR